MSSIVQKFLKRNLLLWTAVGLITLVSPWSIQESLGTPGSGCDLINNNADCDVCNRETCQDIGDGIFECVDGNQGTNPAGEPTPACPDFTIQEDLPDCWVDCAPVIIDGTTFPECSPSDSFCDDVSGGNEASECRSATCTNEPDVDPSNPSGCDFEFDGSDEEVCILCADPQPSDFDACGNGICEQPDETFENCEIDCRVPGFEGNQLDEGDPILDAACEAIIFQPPQLAIAFNPNNEPGSLSCEDGEICSNNTCIQGECDVTPKACSLDDSDLCCPAGCEPPAEGEDCVNDTGCDIDCFVPVDCNPPPPPPVVKVLEGSGCSLNAQVHDENGTGTFVVALLGIGAGLFFSFRKRSATEA